jgi:hypothetical protein
VPAPDFGARAHCGNWASNIEALLVSLTPVSACGRVAEKEKSSCIAYLNIPDGIVGARLAR